MKYDANGNPYTERHGYRATVYHHDSPESPESWSMVGTLAYSHRQASHGDLPSDHYGNGVFSDDCPRCEGTGEEYPEGPVREGDDVVSDELAPCCLCDGRGEVTDGHALARRLHDSILTIPIYSYDGQMGTVFDVPDSWERANGWIFATAASVAETLGADATEEEIRAAMLQELTVWQQWAGGEVYGVVVTDPSGEEVDSCWGFYGDEYAEGEAETMLTDAVAHLDANPGAARAEAIWHGRTTA